MKTAGTVRWSIAASALVLVSAQALAGPTPEQIIAKSQERIRSAKTYQVTYQVTQSMGTMGSMKMTMELKTIPGKKIWMNTTPIGMLVVDDGTTLYQYMATAKQYRKMPSQAAKSSQLAVSQAAAMAKGSTVKLGPTVNIGGKPCYVIEMVPKNAQGRSVLVKFCFEQGTYRLARMNLTAKGPGAPGQPAQSMQMVMTVASEKLNAPIPDSVFKFTPPPGAKEAQPGMPGGMGGMGGMGGGMAPRR